ncbi:YkgJ family cysteine cluster protein [Chryseobacterium sp. GVT01B]|uniref:YkgJ family cysteine cluster protein n=1 Tax=Chryseobacterium sp. GVT01B TaxID=2862675 RepID=UPI001CBE1EC2|nr:YkgJ family cysteine cluster protein [Chryseobacterium sp. GVT01B]
MNKIDYTALKRDIDNIVNQFKNCCSKGCSFCCYQMVEVYDFEVESIKASIKGLEQSIKGKVKSNLEEWFDYFNKYTPENKVLDENDTIKGLIKISKVEKHKCPLLVDNCCSIYENRPLTCRIHLVENHPEKCEKDPYRESSPQSSNVRFHLQRYLMGIRKSQLFFLPHIATEEINIDKKIKPLKKLYI